MHPIVKKTLRSRWFVGCLHASLWLLVYLALINLGPIFGTGMLWRRRRKVLCRSPGSSDCSHWGSGPSR